MQRTVLKGLKCKCCNQERDTRGCVKCGLLVCVTCAPLVALIEDGVECTCPYCMPEQKGCKNCQADVEAKFKYNCKECGKDICIRCADSFYGLDCCMECSDVLDKKYADNNNYWFNNFV